MKQRDHSDCGAACLASIAAYYQLIVPVSRIRLYAGTDRRGTNVAGMIEAAQNLGFEARGAKAPVDSLCKIPLPAIAHVIINGVQQHCVVIYQVKKNYTMIMDPATGEVQKHLLSDFKKIWTGVIILMVPGKSFQTGNKQISSLSRFIELTRPHKGMIFQSFIGAMAFTILGLSTAVYVQKIIDFVIVEGNLRLLNMLSVIMIILLFFQLQIGTIKSLFAIRIGQHIDARLILGYYKHLLRLPQRFFDTMRVGEMISRLNDAVKIRVFINDIALNLIVNFHIFIFSIGLMLFYYWKLAIIIISIIPIYLCIYLVNDRFNKKWQRRIMEDNAELESQLVESLGATTTIKRFDLEEYANEKTENRLIELLKTIYKVSIYNLYSGSLSEFFTRLYTIIVLWMGGFFVINRELSPGELLSFYALIGYFTGPASSLINANKYIRDAVIAADRLFEIIDLESEENGMNKLDISPDMVGDICFNDVHFSYNNRTIIFQNLNLLIKTQTFTAIVGESGSGKSTVLSLLQNLYSPQKGCIMIGDLDIKYISNRSLRNLIGVVPQQTDLFSATIMENIAIGQNEPDIKRVLEISARIGIADFIEKLPNGFHTLLNKQGILLSGGERQRLSIARAMYRNPEILILDEPTASIDAASERKVLDGLQWFMKQGKTIIIISHRLSAIVHSDNILVLHQGRLVEQGNHAELMRMDGSYKKMWDHQTLML